LEQENQKKRNRMKNTLQHIQHFETGRGRGEKYQEAEERKRKKKNNIPRVPSV
jgi:hypothetical protein